ncbi:solute carrier family 22 member 13-like [Haemaphysalis longicornis]
MDFEKVLREVGGFGLFNRTVMVAALILATGNTAMSFFIHVYLLVAPPSQWCFVNGTSREDFPVLSVLPRRRCQLVSLSADGFNVTVADGDTTTCPTGWNFNPSEFFTSVAMENQWVCGESWKMYAVHTAYWAGSMSGNLLSGLLADKIGRKKTTLILLAVGSTCNLLCIFFSDFLSYTIFKFFTGVASYPVVTTVFVLVMEYTVSERRTLVAFLWGTSWMVFGALLPWYAYLLHSWRSLVGSNTAVGILLVFILWWVPESSSWLLSVDRKKEALDNLHRIARANGKIVSKEHLDMLLKVKTSESETQAVTQKALTLWQSTVLMLKSPNIRRITILIYAAWFIISMCYHVAQVQLGRLDMDIYSTYSIAIAFEFPVNIFCILALDTLGRRWPNTAFMFAAGFICLIMWMLKTESAVWTLVMATMMIMAFAGGFNITYQVASEVFPTVIRGRAVLLQRLLGDVGGLVGAQIAALAELDDYLPMLVMGCITLAAGVLVFFLPETMGVAMPQTIEDGESLGQGTGICFCPIFANSGDDTTAAQEKSTKKLRCGILPFRTKLPVTRQPEVNRAFQEDVSVVSTTYNTYR